MTWAEARTVTFILRREYQLACRGPAFWAVAASGCLFALWRASGPDTTAALAAYQTWHISVLGLSVLAILIGAGAAARDRRDASSELVLAKALGSTPHLVVARFAGVWLSLMSVVVIMLAAALLRQLIGGTPWHLGAYANALARTLAPMAMAAALGFSLTTLFANPLAAGVAAVYWVSIPLARTFLPRAADMTPAQHWPVAVLLTAGLVSLTAALYGRSLQGRDRRRPGLGWAAGLLFAAALGAILALALGGEDALVRRDPILTAIASQRTVAEQRAPGFWLPDGQGRLVGLGDFAGRPVALAFWGPAAPESAHVIATLRDAARKFHEAGLAALAVCEDGDSATVGPFAREAGSEVVMLWDRGQHYGDGQQWSDSPVGLVYEVREVPTIFLLDRERRLMARIEASTLGNLDAALASLMGER